MNLWGKREKDRATRSGDGAHRTAHLARPERRFTIGLARADQLAIMLAKSRAARFVEVVDMLAAMYIYEWDRLSKFWDDRKEVEDFLRRMCRISPQRWHHWIEFYDKQRQQEEKELTSPLRRFHRGSKNSAQHAPDEEVALERSSQLEKVLESAGEISPFRDELDDRAIPVLTTECVLFSIARDTDAEVGEKLRQTGLDLSALERAARDPRRTSHR
jgi:hypothetical protein